MADKVYTTTYSDFKGVDYTNDASNVWRKRSPTGVNMLPDESGRPFKRTGWEIFVTNDQIKTWLTDAGIVVDNVEITKLSWFELAGVDHIVIFTNVAVIFYNGEVTAINTDPDCYLGYDRCFFFEGGGTSAFYIYGGYKVWRYDDTFTLNDVTEQATIPRIMVGASADGTGTQLEGYNLVYNKASMEFDSCDLKNYWHTGSWRIQIDWATFKSGQSYPQYSYRCITAGTRQNAVWSPALPASVQYTGSASVDDVIYIQCADCVVLPNNVSQAQINDVKVYKSVGSQFDTELEVCTKDISPSALQCSLWSVRITKDKTVGLIYFNKTTPPSQIVSGEDFIRVEFPTVEVDSLVYGQYYHQVQNPSATPPVLIEESEFNADKTMYYTKSGNDYIQCTDSSVYDDTEDYYIYLGRNGTASLVGGI